MLDIFYKMNGKPSFNKLMLTITFFVCTYHVISDPSTASNLAVYIGAIGGLYGLNKKVKDNA